MPLPAMHGGAGGALLRGVRDGMQQPVRESEGIMSDKTATERLREILDERGVEWEDHGYENHTWWNGRELVGWHAENRPSVNGSYVKIEAMLTPEQAVAATLGSGKLTAEQVRKAIFDASAYASYDGSRYYADGISMQAIADELNAALTEGEGA